MNRMIKNGAVLVATGSMIVGCSAAETDPVSRQREGIEFSYDTASPPANEAVDTGILPQDLPYENIELPGNMYDSAGTTIYHRVAGLDLTRGDKEQDTLEFTAHEDLAEKENAIFRAVLSDSEDLIAAAVDRGSLNHLLFVKGLPSDESTASHYNPFGKVVAITFHEENVSYDELLATTRHELWHAITEGLTFTEEEWEGAYSQACDKVDALYTPRSLEYIAQVVEELQQYIEQKKAKHPEDYADLHTSLQKVGEYLESGKGAEDIWLYCGQLSLGYALSDLEKAALGLPEDSFEGELGTHTVEREIFEDMDPESELYRAIGREFIEGDTLYASVSEYPYVKNEDKERIFLGHAAEASNFTEIWASILNVATYYTDEFTVEVARMEPAEREFVLMFLDLTVKHTIELNPGLADYLNNTLDIIRTKVTELLAD